jgi:hypothetical protein
MSDFSQKLGEELEYTGLLPEELPAKAEIPKARARQAHGGAEVHAPADAVAKIASTLDVSVEHLVTGHTDSREDMAKYLKFRDVLGDFLVLPEAVYKPIKAMIKALARQERESKTHLS